MGGASAAEATEAAAVPGTAAIVAEEVPFLPKIDAYMARYDDVLQGKIESAASTAGGVSSTNHPQRNEGNITDVTCGMWRSSPLRFIRRLSPSKQKLQRGQGCTPPRLSLVQAGGPALPSWC